MASKLSLTFLLHVLVFLSILSQPIVSTASPETNNHGLNVGMISSALSNKGYISMSLILQQTLTTLIPLELTPNTSTTVTIFCPLDKAFFASEYPQPPFTLLQYHVVLQNLNRSDLQSSLPFESKVDTLLPGHPLVVTTPPHDSDRASINGVKVTDWEIYSDESVIVHGVEDFFDPAYQTILYPWYDCNVAKNESDNSTRKDSDKEFKSKLGDKIMNLVVVLTFSGIFTSIACLNAMDYCRRKGKGLSPLILGFF